ncbi:hypothetical protein [Planctomyces sp. SH-PL62]|uniref:hypothetical protein n=1 Tax=Planctomyces sp. SH-PL62 TaxID=1636152 RepID=UPI00078C502A|nr:hypothetical protein [Planctomyces sp. SH-PL62]AMV37857.1 hypothetical protein VT85_10495 [Planctomyces sp. SH-PL62]
MPDDVNHEYKLADAIPDPAKGPDSAGPGGPPEATHATDAEQQREAEKGAQAQAAQGDLKDRLVDIGKAQHMGGRASGRVSDR